MFISIKILKVKLRNMVTNILRRCSFNHKMSNSKFPHRMEKAFHLASSFRVRSSLSNNESRWTKKNSLRFIGFRRGQRRPNLIFPRKSVDHAVSAIQSRLQSFYCEQHVNTYVYLYRYTLDIIFVVEKYISLRFALRI